MFEDRNDAGEQLAELLVSYKNKKNTIVIGLPRGGVVTASRIAKKLNLPLDIIVARKIGMPGEPEAAMGAITVDGQNVFDFKMISQASIDQDYIDNQVEKEKKKAKRSLEMYREKRQPLDLDGKTVILVDDGVATGSTMKVAIKSVKTQKAKKIIIAVPVAPQSFLKDIASNVDEIICIEIPKYFIAVGMAYKNFAQTEDEEVISLMKE